MHIIQQTILKNLTFNKNSRFCDLNEYDLLTDHFSYHIRKLVKDGYIVKQNNKYELTKKGMLEVSRLDLKENNYALQPIIGVALFITKHEKGRKYVLLEKRKYNPNKGLIGFHSEKLYFGESFEEATKRCLLTETGLLGKFKYSGTIRIIRKEGSINIQDFLLHYFRVTELKGQLTLETQWNYNKWFLYSDIKFLKNTFPDFQEDFKFVISKNIFQERISTI